MSFRDKFKADALTAGTAEKFHSVLDSEFDFGEFEGFSPCAAIDEPNGCGSMDPHAGVGAAEETRPSTGAGAKSLMLHFSGPEAPKTPPPANAFVRYRYRSASRS